MSIALVRPRAVPRTSDGEPSWVITRHVARSARRWAIIWGVVFGFFVMATVKAFVVGFPTVASRLALTHSLQAFAMLMGVPHHAETVAGFITWRILVVCVIIGGIWGLLTSTGLLRGQEDIGQWEVLLAGRTTKRRAAAEALIGLGCVLAVMFAITALFTLAAAQTPGARFSLVGSLLFAFALVSGGAVFLAVGALASQLSATRGQAAMLASAVLGVSFVIRMVADSSTSLGWLRWLSPIGWVEELHPLQDVQPLPLILIVGLVLGCSGGAVWLAGRRDLYAGVLREPERPLTEGRWLLGPTSLALRLSRTTAIAWLVGLAGLAATYGYLERAATSILTSSPTVAATLGRLGVKNLSNGYFSIVFFMMAILIAVLAAAQLSSIRDEEAHGRLDNLLVRPIPRLRWLAGRFLISLTLLVLAGLGVGLATWEGASLHHTRVALPALLSAGLNATIPGIFVLSVGVLILGIRPRLTSFVAYSMVAWSFLVDLLGGLIKGKDWVRDLSVFHHISLAPATAPDWGTALLIVGIGVAAALVGAAVFQRRDIEYA
ncbi:MAG TPA: hypothetical protein VGK54_05450 [Chloroflexota bacterium]